MSLLAVTPWEFLAVGTFWFWTLLLAEIIFLFVLVESEKGFAATVSVVGYLAILQFLVGLDLISYVGTHPLYAVLGFIGYFVVGTLWGIAKWYLFVTDKRQIYEDRKAKWLADKNVTGTTVPDELKVAWAAYIQDQNGRYSSKEDAIPVKPPKARENKAKIMRWMAFWVVSMLWSLVDDFVRRAFQRIYYRIAAQLQKMSDSIFASTKNDLPEQNP